MTLPKSTGSVPLMVINAGVAPVPFRALVSVTVPTPLSYWMVMVPASGPVTEGIKATSISHEKVPFRVVPQVPLVPGKVLLPPVN